MTTPKLLLLAGFAVLSLGSGAAYAQSEMPGDIEGLYCSGQNKTTSPTVNHDSGQVQSGSSDLDTHDARPASPFDYGTLANPG